MSGSVMVMLRDGTADLHTAAERQPFQRALIKGQVSRPAYIAYLEQMLLVHSALEEALAACGEPFLRGIVGGEQFQGPNLRADLGALGERARPGAMPGAARLIAQVEKCNDGAALLGHLYVLEGSKNGNSFVARAVRASLGIEPGQGDRYLDPHGPRQREVWAEFKARMDAAAWTQPQRETMLGAARAMFAAVSEIAVDLDGVLAHHPVDKGDAKVALEITR